VSWLKSTQAKISEERSLAIEVVVVLIFRLAVLTGENSNLARRALEQELVGAFCELTDRYAHTRSIGIGD